MLMKNKVLAVALSAPVSDVLSVVVTLLLFVPGFYNKMKSTYEQQLPVSFEMESVSEETFFSS